MSLNYLELSNKFSLKTLLNSFVRDYHADERVFVGKDLKFKFVEGIIVFKFKRKSILGSHEYQDKILLSNEEISFEYFVELLGNNFSTKENRKEFIHNVLDSRNTLLEILKNNEGFEINSYLESEQQLLLGHPFHPYPKCKKGMNTGELKKYAPEFQGHFKLFWIRIKKTLFYSNLSVEEYKESISDLVSFDLGENINKGIYIPMHPWQWQRVKKRELFLISEVEEVGYGQNLFNSLSSMRSLFNVESPLQIKCSIDLKLTNSIRHLQKEESQRGKEVYSVLNSLESQKCDTKFDVLFEPFFIGISGKDGEVLNDTFIQFRDSFKKSTDFKNTYLLSSLCEVNPFSKESLINSQIDNLALTSENNHRLARKIWFTGFLENVLAPFLNLSTREGVLLGAHMQNLLITIKDSIPSGVTFRDCQGTGFTEKGHDNFSKSFSFIKKENGNVLTDDDVNKVYGYYLIVNTVFSTISSIAKSDAKVELELLNLFRSFIYDLNSELNGNNFLEYILNSKVLYQKGNSRCSLLGINENTQDNPWDIYNQIENPIHQLRALSPKVSGILYSAKTKKNTQIAFRVLELSDLDIFFKWHHKDFVSEFWELNVPKEEILKYIKKIKKSSFQLPLILEVEGKAVGYFEVYWAFDDRIAPYCDAEPYDRGIHLLIGEEKFLKKRIVYDSLVHISKFLFEANEKTQKVWGEPRADNSSILKLSERLPGWKILKEFQFPHKKAALLECDRARFFKELKNAL